MKWVNNYSPAQPSPGSPPSHKYIVPALYWSWTWNDLRIWYFIVLKLLLLSCSSCSPSCPLATVDCSYIIAACPPATLHSSKSQRMSTGIRIVVVVKGRKDSFNILYIWIDNRYCYLVKYLIYTAVAAVKHQVCWCAVMCVVVVEFIVS